MGRFETASLDEIYHHITRTAHLAEAVVARKPASMSRLSFVELDSRTRQDVMPDIEEMNDVSREKARFMLDVCQLVLLRKQKRRDRSSVVGVDVHLSTLMKTSFRTRYLVVLTDYLKGARHEILLNIKAIPRDLNTTRLSDTLRYLIPIPATIALEISQRFILDRELKKLAVKHFVISLAELSKINASRQREATMQRLAALAASSQQLIVRNPPPVVVRQPEEVDAFYL